VEGVAANANGSDPLANFYPQKYSELIHGKTVTDVGVQPILHMKSFMDGQKFSDELVRDIQTRTPGAGSPDAN
jgi:quinolinate synthase